MGSRSVGFQVQGDVVGGTSLAHNAIGHLLKALNNSGVDHYAVIASVQLGKLMPLTQEREAVVSQLLNRRRESRESYLSKALRIGWGYTDLPHELARTRAGISALNIIGALATGTTPFEAAKAMSTLMQISGCDTEALPSLDSLKIMIEFLAPFVTNSTFDAVLATVRLACVNVLRKKGLATPDALHSQGDGKQWARAVKHLVATSETTERAHIAVGQRGAWLSAFSAHILGLSVKVYFQDIILWESLGPNGSVNLYVYGHNSTSSLVRRHKPPDFILEPADTVGPASREMPLMLPLNQLFEYGLSCIETVTRSNRCHNMDFDEPMIEHIREAIHDFSEHIFDSSLMTLEGQGAPHWPMNGYFPLRKDPLRFALQHLRIIGTNSDLSIVRQRVRNRIECDPPETASFQHLDDGLPRNIKKHTMYPAIPYLRQETATRLLRTCEAVEAPQSLLEKCVCHNVASFISGMSSLAVALAQCSYDAETLRVHAKILEDFSCRFTFDFTRLDDDWQKHGKSKYSLTSLFAYLIRALGLRELGVSAHSSGDLAWSQGAMSVYIRPLFDFDCFDSYGRIMVIAPGHISCRGLRRNSVTDGSRFAYSRKQGAVVEGEVNTFTVHTELSPYFAIGPIAHESLIDVDSNAVSFAFELFHLARRRGHGPILSIGLFDCIQQFFAKCKTIGDNCGHEREREYVVKQSHSPVRLHTFGDLSPTFRRDASETLLFAVAESPIAQMMQAVLLREQDYCIGVQGNSCLDCIIRNTRSRQTPVAIFMT